MHRQIAARLARSAAQRAGSLSRPALAGPIRSSAIAGSSTFRKFSNAVPRFSHGESESSGVTKELRLVPVMKQLSDQVSVVCRRFEIDQQAGIGVIV